MKDIHKRKYGLLLIYLLIILFITVLVRKPSLVHLIKAQPFWSYRKTVEGNPRYLREIILNIGLFVPLGWFLMDVVNGKYRVVKAVFVALLISVLIETIQYFSYRGYCDIDDLISNTIGAGIGVVLFLLFHGTEIRKLGSIVLLLAGVTGCVYTVVMKPETDNADYFDFQVSAVSYTGGRLELQGFCYKYNQEPSPFEMILVAGERYTAEVETEGQEYTASVEVQAGEKYEIQVKFKGDQWISADTYVRVGETAEVEYVPGDVEIPDGVPEGAILKAYSKQYDTYVFELDGRIIWLIGRELDSNTEVIYHIHTDEPEKLPETRIQYGFDNRGFRAKKNEKHRDEVEGIGHYRVFVKEIPEEFRVTEIVVGFNTDKTIAWRNSFRINHSLTED